MYGSIMRGTVKPGRREEFDRLMCELSLAHVAENSGLLSVELGGTGDDVVMVLRFMDRDTYIRNSDDPRTQRNYARWSALLLETPQWTDVEWGEFIGHSRIATVSGSAEAPLGAQSRASV